MLVLNHEGQLPLYVQLYNHFKEAILAGRVKSHAKLPSVRDLATELSVSRNTVESAYLELYAEGYIYSKARSGYFVAAVTQDLSLLSATPMKAVREVVPEEGPPCAFDFHPARLDPESFPAQIWRTCFLDALRQTARDLNHYREPQGEYGLRCQIHDYLHRSRGVVCGVEQIVICPGLQHGLEVVAHLLEDHSTAIAVEDPGYHLTRSVFRNNSFEVLPIPVRADGMDIDALEKSGCAVAYVTPSHQFPMGYVMPIANRLKLIQWGKSRGKLIIEDDYDSELRYHGKPIPSVQGLDPGGNILYYGTFSKVLSPALRISYLVLPYSLLPRYRRLFRDHVSSVSLLEQRTLANFMAQGHWERHVRRMRTLYKKKHDALLRAVHLCFGDRARVVGEGAGLHLVLQFPGHAGGEDELLDSARQEGIELFPFSATCVRAKPEAATVILGFGGLSMERSAQGVELLSKIWK